MILILAGIIIAAILFGALCYVGEAGYQTHHLLAAIIGAIGLGLCGVFMLAYIVLCWNWVAAEYKTKVINREYDTTYTRAEVFYAEDVIEVIRQLDRKRYEINGDLFQEKKQ